jgi:hypothetical protein
MSAGVIVSPAVKICNNSIRYANLVRLKVLHLEHNQINRLPGLSGVYGLKFMFVILLTFETPFSSFRGRACGYDGDHGH